MNFKSLPQLLNYFKDENTCVEYLEKQRWNNEPVCPFCGSKHVYRTNRGFKCANKECHKKFTVTVGTVFENSKIKLNIWFAAIYLCTAHKKGISSLQLHRDLGVTQKTAWFMLHRIREIMKTKAPEMLTGTVECDETFIGGKDYNKHDSKKNACGRGYVTKTPVFGMLENDNKVYTKVVEEANGQTLKPIIRKKISKSANLVTDGFGAYSHLDREYNHIIINHAQGEYTNGEFHTNGIENFWSILKRGIYGIYHSSSPKHLHGYCDEFSYRFNTREISDQERFSMSLTSIDGRLTYNQLIDKK